MQTILKSEADSRRRRVHIAYALLISIPIIWYTLYCQTVKLGYDYFSVWNKKLSYSSKSHLAGISEVKAQTPEALTMKEWVLNEVAKAGLNPDEADCLIKHESSWNPEGWLINKGGNRGADQGLWAINSKYHPEVSHACNFDYKCQTREAIRIRRANGNWNQWYGFINFCQ